jgi:hypothetical protein
VLEKRKGIERERTKSEHATWRGVFCTQEFANTIYVKQSGAEQSIREKKHFVLGG